MFKVFVCQSIESWVLESGIERVVERPKRSVAPFNQLLFKELTVEVIAVIGMKADIARDAEFLLDEL